MSHHSISRRKFIQGSAALAGVAAITPAIPATTTGTTGAAVRTATDLVSLGKSGLKISRLGIGTGSNGGKVQRDLGQEGFNRLIRYAYDRGVTYIDTADAYGTHELIRGAVRGSFARQALGANENALGSRDSAKTFRGAGSFPQRAWHGLRR
ncbi:MAG: aldo/keto reductase [Pyrinomonadaceae bacterium]